MNDRHIRVLELVRAGVCRKPDLASQAGVSVRAMKDILTSLAAHGYVVSVKTDAHDWSWVPAESAVAIRAAVAAKVKETNARIHRRTWERKKARAALPVPRGHGEEVRQAVTATYRPIKKTAAASVWELGSSER